MTEPRDARVCAVVVSYQPAAATLQSLLAAVLPQVHALVLVDNASHGDWQAACAERLAAAGGALLAQPHNLGLAGAQNIGIDWARARACTHVLLLDQDSLPAPDMVNALLDGLRVLARDGAAGAVGPRFRDLHGGRDAPFVRIGFPFNRKLHGGAAVPLVACDFLIGSGMLIPLPVLDAVGAMDDSLFIDNVDLEWGFRARAAGYSLHGVYAATMDHHLGDARRRLPLGLGQVVVHGPSRLYYMMRNRVRLYRMPHVPALWTAQDVPRVLVKLFLFGVLVGPRWRNLHAMLRGLGDGLRGRRGA